MDFSNIIQSTAGAIPFINEKGDVSMQKVKVQRYITGKRPAYAPDSDQEHSDDDRGALNDPEEILDDLIIPIDDNTFRNLSHSPRKPVRKHRPEPEILYEAADHAFSEEYRTLIYDSDENERYLDEQEIAIKRQMMKQDLTHRAKCTNDVLEYEDEISEKEEQFSSEYEEYSDSEEEIGSLRLKPFFVNKEDRVTICSDEKKDQESKLIELVKHRQIDDKKRESHQLLEEIICLEKQMEQSAHDTEGVVLTDDENDEIEYEEWKLRELKRIRRDREERERFDKEKEDIERIHLMSERERKFEFEKYPRFIPNKQSKEKQYKFLQKYYHRGAFFLNKEEDVYKRDFSKPTLEDHFNKQVLPKVMQVKSFGRSGRTKYTHLLDQDTTQKDSNPWAYNDPLAIKFHNKGGGMKQTFEKPTPRRKRLHNQS